MSVGERIKKRRKEIGYSQEQLAEILYIKKSTICRYENDKHDIPSSVIVELANALQTTPNFLLLEDSNDQAWKEDMIAILDRINDPSMRKIALRQLQCIVDSDS